jgi:murein DD-endopeptidase MepM/ murein hydrolase activator NlpD
MLRLVVLVGLLTLAAWLAREAEWWPMVPAAATVSPHTSYAQTLERSGLARTALGRAWLDASEHVLATAARVDLPIQQRVPFDLTSAHQPLAWAFRVTLQRGQRLDATADLHTPMPATAFIDIFESSDASDDESRGGQLRAAQFEADAPREVLVRVQPELFRAGQLDIMLRVVPALHFPVARARPQDLQSIFGDPRDAGRRRHEGVDIFARRGTPVLSASDGIVTRVAETRLGGRVVWVWDPTRGLRLYYAHLNEQLVRPGERLRAGDVIGTVGNTGNARTTPPHLHFGIYETWRGAIDPYWFIASPGRDTSAAFR